MQKVVNSIKRLKVKLKVVFSVFNRIHATRTNGINNIQKTVFKFVFMQTTEANPQPSKKNETREPVLS